MVAAAFLLGAAPPAAEHPAPLAFGRATPHPVLFTTAEGVLKALGLHLTLGAHRFCVLGFFLG